MVVSHACRATDALLKLSQLFLLLLVLLVLIADQIVELVIVRTTQISCTCLKSQSAF